MRYGSEPPRMPEVNWPIVEDTTTIAREAGCAQRRQQRLREPDRRQHVDREALLDVAAEASATPPRRSTPALCTSTCSCGASVRRLRGRPRARPRPSSEVAPHRLAAEVDRGAARVDLGTRVAEHPRALRSQRGHDGRPDAAPGARDERRLSVEKHPGSVGAVAWACRPGGCGALVRARKVRTPQGRVLGNAQAGKPDGRVQQKEDRRCGRRGRR